MEFDHASPESVNLQRSTRVRNRRITTAKFTFSKKGLESWNDQPTWRSFDVSAQYGHDIGADEMTSDDEDLNFDTMFCC